MRSPHLRRPRFVTDEDVGEFELKRIKRADDKIRREYPGSDIRWDVADVTIHKLLLPTDEERSDRVEFYVIDEDGESRLLVERSPILQSKAVSSTSSWPSRRTNLLAGKSPRRTTASSRPNSSA